MHRNVGWRFTALTQTPRGVPPDRPPFRLGCHEDTRPYIRVEFGVNKFLVVAPNYLNGCNAHNTISSAFFFAFSSSNMSF
jgi:hypothetical protein